MDLINLEDVMDSAEDPTAAIRDRIALAEFVASLREDLESDESSWENPTLLGYLDALERFVRDMDGLERNLGIKIPEQPTWALVGRILLAAKHYE